MDWEKISFKADENSPLPKYQQIAREIEAVIRTSRLAPGTKLPGNRLLADCFHTTAVTIGKALDGLAARGLIECRHQSGTYVCDTALPGSRRIAVFRHKITSGDYGFIGPIVDTLYRRFSADGYQMISLVAKPGEYLQFFDEFQLAGCVVLTPEENFFPQIRKLREENIPVVTIGTAGDEYRDFAFGTDHAQAAERAVRYLHSLGHTRIGIVSSEGNIAARQRKAAYASAMWLLGLPVNPGWELDGGDLGRDFERVFSGAELPEALLLTNSEQVIQIYNLCHQHGIKIPDDLSLISFLDSDYVSMLNPPMTVIGQHLEKFTLQAAEQLEKMIRQEKISVPEESFSGGKLIERGSCLSKTIQKTV